ncbi:glycosyltransferase [Chloropicon primus]|nr:glycosyltransferase [Chloropicon primus]|eukprot:QDZ26039.1 glycosyltransferase [Chloropicon primus]
MKRNDDEDDEEERIPKLLHFTWKTDDLSAIPKHFRDFHLRWKEVNPTWDAKIWTDDDILVLVERHYPKWLRIMKRKLLAPVVKADIFRYMLMDRFGGVYADMDMEPIKPMEELIRTLGYPTCILGQEPREHALLLEEQEVLVCNAVLVSVPGHPLWQEVLESIYLRMTTGWMKYHPNPNPVELTGPKKLTQVLEATNEKLSGACELLEPDVFYPLADNSASLDKRCISLLKRMDHQGRGDSERARKVANACGRVLRALEKQIQRAKGLQVEPEYPDATYAVHHWTHTWISRHKKELQSHV